MAQIATVTPVIQNVTITTPNETVTVQAHVRNNVTISTDTIFVAPSGSGTGSVTQVDTGTGLTGGPITTSGTVALEALSSNPSGNYQHATILVDAYGRVTAASSGTDSAGVTSVLGGNHLNHTVAGSVVTVNHDSPGTSLSQSQFVESIAVDAYGHVTSVTESSDQLAARTFLGLGDASTKAVGTTSGTVAAGDDARFTDARTPLPHNQTLSTITDSGSAAALDVPSSGDATTSQVVKGDDSRLTDARAPTEHNANRITSGTLGIDRIPTITLAKVSDAGTAAAAATGDFEANGAIANHNAITTAHGISAFGATLVNDANAGAARTTLGATTVGSNVFTAASQAAARSAIGVGTGTGDMVGSNNLSEITNESTARGELGLGTSSTLNVPSSGDAASGEVVKGNDTRLTDARTPTTTLDHNADKITTGQLVAARGGTGLSSISTLLNSNTTKSDVGLGNVENTAISTFSGSSNITQVGTISSGTWGGTAIAYADVSGTPTLGTASAAATGDFEASGSIATHNAITTAHGISAFGASLVDDADATAARATLGAAGTNHSHSIGQITGAGTAAASATGDFVAATAVSTFGGTLIDDADAAAARTTLGVTNTGSYTGHIETAADKTYVLDPSAATDRTISAFYIKVNSGSGTVSATLKVGGSDVKTVTASTSTGVITGLHPSASVGSAGDAIELVFASNSSATDVIFSVEYTE